MIAVVVAVLLLAGFFAIWANERAYQAVKTSDTQVYAEILAASVAPALDFGDAAAAQEAVVAARNNKQIRLVGVYDREGRLVAGFDRRGVRPPDRLAENAAAAGDEATALAHVTSAGERIGWLLLAVHPEPPIRRATRYLISILLIGMAGLVIIVLGLAQGDLRRANAALAARAASLAELNAELVVQASERAKAEEQLRQSQKLQSLGQLTGGIAHDFNNLLTVIQGSADMLVRPGVSDDKRLRYAGAIVEASSKAASLTGQLLAFARRQPLDPERLDVDELIGGMRDLMSRTLGERYRIGLDPKSETCIVEADRTQLEAALLNIAVNARDAMPDGGALEISTRVTREAGQSMVAITLADEGAGMDEATLARAVEPFFTTKEAGRGTGLGLSQVHGFAGQSGGDVRIESRPGKGTRVTMLLPCAGASQGAPQTAAAEPVEALSRGRILLVEDNEEVGRFAEGLIRELGHRVIRAVSGEEALVQLRLRPFDLVFTDIVMPGMTGLELAEAIGREYPDLPVVLTTGFSDDVAQAGNRGWPVILKPYRLESLAGALERELRKS